MTILKGPADADHFRVKVGRYGDRWYADPLEGCDIAPASDWSGPSISIVKKASGSDWTFVGLKRAAAGLQADAVACGTLDVASLYDRLKSYNARGLDRAADRGSIVHLWAEDLLNGNPIDDDETSLLFRMRGKIAAGALEDARTYQPALRDFFDKHQPQLVASEIVCLHRTLNGAGYGGTADAVVCIDGTDYVIDWKSRGLDSDHAAYPEEAAQVSALARAEYSLLDCPAGPVRARLAMDAGLIVSIRPDGFRAYPIDVDKGFAHWTALHAWWVARRDERKSVGRAWAPKGSKVTAGEVAPAGTSDTSPADPFDGLDGRPEGKASVEEIAELTRVYEACIEAGFRQQVIDAWPASIPGPKRAGEWTRSQAETVREVLGQHAPFGAHPDDPKPEPDRSQWVSAETTEPKLHGKRYVRGTGAEGILIHEGLDVDPDAVGALRAKFEALTTGQRSWIGSITGAAREAGTEIHVTAKPSARRFELARALVGISQSAPIGDADDYGEFDDAVRALAALALGSDDPLMPGIHPGVTLGAMSAAEAATFARLADEFLEGRLSASVDDNGVLRLQHAA